MNKRCLDISCFRIILFHVQFFFFFLKIALTVKLLYIPKFTHIKYTLNCPPRKWIRNKMILRQRNVSYFRTDKKICVYFVTVYKRNNNTYIIIQSAVMGHQAFHSFFINENEVRNIIHMLTLTF